jgi:predicted nucleic acid-binding protein
MSCILDTNILYNILLKDDEKLKMEFEQALFEGREVCISTITYYEQKRAILRLERPDKPMDQFEKLIKSIKLLSFAQPTADIASKIYADLNNIGKPISSCDYLIGATALENDLPIVTEDGHFDHIDGIKREKWRRA